MGKFAYVGLPTAGFIAHLARDAVGMLVALFGLSALRLKWAVDFDGELIGTGQSAPAQYVCFENGVKL